MDEVNQLCRFRFSVFSFVCALISIIGIFYMVMIGNYGSFFDYKSDLKENFIFFIIAIFPYLILYIILYLVRIKTRQGSCKKLYTMCTIVLLFVIAITALEWKAWIWITTIHYSDGADAFIVMFAKVAQIVLSLFVWLILAFFLRYKKINKK